MTDNIDEAPVTSRKDPEDNKAAENIRVAVRCRPMNEREQKLQSKSCFACHEGTAILRDAASSEEHRSAELEPHT